MLKNQKGFSLVELMIVVAIIGILAAIAIPNFQRFQEKAKQSEAKGSLSGVYTAEQAFYAEFTDYSSQFDQIGFAPTGNVAYETGFSAARTSAAPSAPPSGGTCFNTGCSGVTGTGAAAGLTCVASFATTGWQCNEPVKAPGAIAASTATATTFIATAQTFLNGSAAAVADTWTINEVQQLKNTVNGL